MDRHIIGSSNLTRHWIQLSRLSWKQGRAGEFHLGLLVFSKLKSKRRISVSKFSKELDGRIQKIFVHIDLWNMTIQLLAEFQYRHLTLPVQPRKKHAKMKSTNSNLFLTLVYYAESVGVSDLGTSGDVTIHFLFIKAADGS